MGSNQATLKGEAKKVRSIESLCDTYKRTLTRAGDSVTFNGYGYLDEPEVAELFACLL